MLADAVPEPWRHTIASTRLPLTKATMHKTIPIGTRFGRLVIDSEPFKLQGYEAYIYYDCQCDCGNRRPVRSIKLTYTPRHRNRKLVSTTSCGCRMRESSKENGHKSLGTGAVTCKYCGLILNKEMGAICFKCTYSKRRLKSRTQCYAWREKSRQTPIGLLRLRRGQAIARSKSQGINVQDIVSLSQLLSLWENQQGKCAITQIPMNCDKHSPYAISVDRIKPSHSYTADNVQLVCHIVNLAKWRWTNETVLTFLNQYADLHNGKELVNLDPLVESFDSNYRTPNFIIQHKPATS